MTGFELDGATKIMIAKLIAKTQEKVAVEIYIVGVQTLVGFVFGKKRKLKLVLQLNQKNSEEGIMKILTALSCACLFHLQQSINPIIQ